MAAHGDPINQQALQIISKSNGIKVSFNVPINDNYSSVYKILIHESNATVLKELHEVGFSLFMTEKGLSVEKIGE